MKAKALVETLWHRIEEKVGTLYNTVGEVEAAVLVNKVARKVSTVEAQDTWRQADRDKGRGDGRYTW